MPGYICICGSGNVDAQIQTSRIGEQPISEQVPERVLVERRYFRRGWSDISRSGDAQKRHEVVLLSYFRTVVLPLLPSV